VGPYREDTVKPGNIYAEHKLEMKKRVLDVCPDAVMLRAECAIVSGESGAVTGICNR